MSGRQLIVVDCETSGLRDWDVPVEIAWWNVDTAESGLFVPAHDPGWVRPFGQPAALKVNGYRDRLQDAEQDTDGASTRALYGQLIGNVLVGANPRFDARNLGKTFMQRALDPEPWHHRIADVEVYACGVLGIDLREIPSLARLCERLDIPEEGEIHTAAGGVKAAVEVLDALQWQQQLHAELPQLDQQIGGGHARTALDQLRIADDVITEPSREQVREHALISAVVHALLAGRVR